MLKSWQKYEGKLSKKKQMISMLFMMNHNPYQHKKETELLKVFNSSLYFVTRGIIRIRKAR